MAELLPQSGEPETLDNLGIDMSALRSEFELSKTYVEQYTRDFVELDNLVDAVPLNKDNDAPFVGDTTLAGLVRSIPRNSLKQLPVLSAVVNGSKHSITALICSFLLRKTAFNEDTFGKGLLSTLQIGAEESLKHGYAPFLVATGSMYNDFGTTMRLIHYSDTSPEPGIGDANESGYHYVVAHLTPTRVKKILKTAENNENTAWNVPALRAVLESQPRAKSYTQFQSAPRQNASGEDAGPTYEFITRYETGPGAKIITFCTDVTEAPLRVLDSKSKWGYPRVQYLVIDPAALTPFGISRVRLASPNQNLSNIYYGNVATMLLLNSKPPILQKGVFLKPPALKQNALWQTLDPNAEARLMTMDNGTLQQFTNFGNYFAGQIQNIMGGQSVTVSPNSKNDAFGKTTVGQKRASEYMDVETNQITKILENFLRQYALVALDTLLSEQEGEDTIIVDDDTKNSINSVAAKSFVPQPDPMTGMMSTFIPPIGDDNKIAINWTELYDSIEEWSVEVDVSLSPDELKDQKRADMQDMLVTLLQNDDGTDPEMRVRAKELVNMLMQDKTPLAKPIEPTVTPPMPQLPGQQPPEVAGNIDPRLTQV